MLLLFLLPLFFALLVPNQKAAFIYSLAPLALLVTGHTEPIQVDWFIQGAIKFHLAADNLSLIFLYLVAVIVPITILVQKDKYSLTLLLQGLLIGFFSSQDLLFFAFFFEAILLPLFFMLEKPYKFIIYMVAGSCLMVAAVLSVLFGGISSTVVAAIFLLAFAVKTPLFPFHGWLADTYCLAPTSATILLSSLLSKAGIYGLLRISYRLFPAEMLAWSDLLVMVAIGGVLYGAFAAWGQLDYKRLIAYSSLSHVNFILVGIFAGNMIAQQGAIFSAINHSITIAGLFLVAGWLEVRLQSTNMLAGHGLTAQIPRLAWLTLFFILSSVALPGLNTFISEIMVLYGLFQISFWQTLLVGTTVVLSVIYMLRWFHSLYFNKPTGGHYSDIQTKELLIGSPLVLLILWFGIYPTAILTIIQSIK